MGEESRIDEYRRCAAAGMSKAETARALWVTYRAVDYMARRHGIAFRPDGGATASARMKAKWATKDWRKWMTETRHELNDIADDEIEDFRATHEAATRDEALEQAGLSGMLRDFE